jgi:hypothetical protein
MRVLSLKIEVTYPSAHQMIEQNMVHSQRSSACTPVENILRNFQSRRGGRLCSISSIEQKENSIAADQAEGKRVQMQISIYG